MSRRNINTYIYVQILWECFCLLTIKTIFSLAIGIYIRSWMKRILTSWKKLFEEILGSKGSKGSGFFGKVFEIEIRPGSLFLHFFDPWRLIIDPWPHKMTLGVSVFLILTDNRGDFESFLWFLDKKCPIFFVWGQHFFSRGLYLECFWPCFFMFFIFMNVLFFVFSSFFLKKEKKRHKNSQKQTLGS